MARGDVNQLGVTLRSMTEQEFFEIYDIIIAEHAEGLVQFGNMTKEDLRAQYDTLLPDGFHTSGTEFSVVVNTENEEVGFVLLIERQPGVALIMHIEIKEEFRRRGYARSVITLVESEMGMKNYRMLALNVMENNKRARSLYESCGFEIHSIDDGAITMFKPLAK